MRSNKDKAITKIQCALGCINSDSKTAREFLNYAIEYLQKDEGTHFDDISEYEQLMLDALKKWGLQSQKLIWIEEMSELIQAIAKSDREINPSYEIQVLEELADVDICLDQMKILYPNYEEIKKQKIARLKRLVKGAA